MVVDRQTKPVIKINRCESTTQQFPWSIITKMSDKIFCNMWWAISVSFICGNASYLDPWSSAIYFVLSEKSVFLRGKPQKRYHIFTGRAIKALPPHPPILMVVETFFVKLMADRPPNRLNGTTILKTFFAASLKANIVCVLCHHFQKY